MRTSVSRFMVPALLLTATPAAAQQRDSWDEYDGPRRIEIAFSGGLFLSTAWSDRVFLESFSALGPRSRQVLLRGFSMAPEFGGAAAVTYWKGRYGFRVQAGFVHSCASTGNACDDGPILPVDETAIGQVDMNQYTYGIQGIVGLTEYSPQQSFRPYVIVGAGGVTYDLDQPLTALLPGTVTTAGPVRIDRGEHVNVIVNDPTTLVISTSEASITSTFALNFGIGTDVRAAVGSGAWGFRFELSDQIAQSPLSVRVARLDGEFFTPWGCTNQCDDIAEITFNDRYVHNWRLSAGIFLEFGMKGDRSPDRNTGPK